MLSALYAAFFTYSLLSMFFGNAGVLAQERQNRRMGILSGHVESLETRRLALEARFNTLRGNADAVMIEARSLGLYVPGQKVAVFRNLEPLAPVAEAAPPVRPAPLPQTDRSGLRLTSAAAGVLVLLLFLLFGRVRNAAEAK